jgi:hypothetical protein
MKLQDILLPLTHSAGTCDIINKEPCTQRRRPFSSLPPLCGDCDLASTTARESNPGTETTTTVQKLNEFTIRGVNKKQTVFEISEGEIKIPSDKTTQG